MSVKEEELKEKVQTSANKNDNADALFEGIDIESILDDNTLGEGFINVNTDTTGETTNGTGNAEGNTGTNTEDKKSIEEKDKVDKDIEDFINVNTEKKKDDDDKKEITSSEGNTGSSPTGTSSSSSSTSSQSSTAEAFKMFADVLHKGGVLPNLDIENFEGTKEELVDAVVDEIDNGIEDFKESLPAGVRDFIDAFKEGVPMDTYLDIRKQQLNYESITEDQLEEDENLQETVLKDYLTKYSKLSKKEISEFVTYHKDSDSLKDKAKEAKNKLVDSQKQEAKALRDEVIRKNKEAEQRYEETKKTIKKNISGLKEIIPGISLNKRQKDSIFKSLTEPAGYINNTPVTAVQLKKQEDPIRFETTLHYLLDLGVFDGKWDKILSLVETKNAQKIKDSISTNTAFKSNAANKSKSNSNTGDDFLTSLNRMFGNK